MNRDKFKSLLKDNNQAKTKAELENDPFLSDALEGYGTLDIQDLKKLDKRFYNNRGILNFSLVILFVSTFAIGGLIFKKDTSKRSSIIDKNTSLTQSKPNSNLVNIKNDTIISDGAMGEIITTKTIKNNQFLQRNIPIQNTEVFSPEVNANNDVGGIPNDKKFVELKLRKNQLNQIKSRTNIGKETYMQDLLILDYRFYRSKPKIELETILNGTPASQEIFNESENMSNELEISYMNFLSKTLKQFNNSKYQLAAERFEAILEKYPDDVNALFYQSICYFNMNQYELAVSKFKRLEMSFYTNFQQDQEWYLMLCYKALGKHKLFRNQKNQIIARNGFYSLRAQKTKFN